ncbi:MAG TPA: ABC-F family ATP-binding cassette domain-containing protein [Syntrophobacteria bacterium]|nr:ABC-F family ATP-binding cassette domain-containing protein [Syntrophobacteria bacterium]
MISFSRVNKLFGKQDILVDCSFQVNPGERVGIIGANGSGKSTIFRLLLGLEDPDQGQISVPKNLRLGYLPQDVLQFRGKTVLAQVLDVAAEVRAIEEELALLARRLEEPLPEKEMAATARRQSFLLEEYHRLGGYDLEVRARKVLAGLGFKEGDVSRPVEEMSGGWAMRVALARILLAEPDVILLDEPTNHLDLDSLLWLEEYLVQVPSALMLVSHDRVFLDRVVQRLLEVENGKVTSYAGNFQRYLDEKEKQVQSQWAAYNHQQEQIRQIRRFVDRNRARKDRARQVQGRLKLLEKMEMIAPPTSQARFSFRFPPPERSARVVLEFQGLSKSYGDLPVYRDLDLTIQREDRVAFLGPNGAGKTTLLKLMVGGLSPDAGQRVLGTGVRTAYFAQQQLELLNPQQTVIESLRSIAGGMPHGQIRSLLGAFLFRDQEVEKLISVLSGGERSRLLLCHMLVQQANFLLLDEPTNHLDIPGRRVLEDALKAYEGTICLVTHDRHLINAVCNKVLVVRDGRVEVFPGNYRDYEEIWKKRLEMPAPLDGPEAARKEPAAPARKGKEQKRLEAAWRNELHRQKAPLASRLEELEQAIDSATRRLDDLGRLLAAPETYRNGSPVDELTREYYQLKRALEGYTRQWEETALKLEGLEEAFWQEKALER